MTALRIIALCLLLSGCDTLSGWHLLCRYLEGCR